tara:strand:- start:244 stop:864 length:621 start_codon:yes stop_codon:yes gene_type:complete
MSWLSKALGGNTLKIGAMIAGTYFGSKYLFGSDYTVTDPYRVEAFGEKAYQYTGKGLAPSVFNALNVTPFQETAFGQSAVGKAITGVGSFLNIGKGSDDENAVSLFSKAIGAEFGRSPSIPQIDVSGYGARSDLNFQAGRAQLFQTGRGGALAAALGRDATQQYLARQVRSTIGLPGASKLPAVTGVALNLKTTAGGKRSYRKMTT